MNKSVISEALDILRFPLAIVVVLIHVFSVGPIMYGVPNGAELSLFNGFSIFISAFLKGISVPIYFFISGYVFFREKVFSYDLYKHKIKNRLKTLLIPYIVWNSVAIILIALKSLPIFSSFLSYEGTTCDFSIENIVSCFWKYNGKLSPPPQTVNQYEIFVQTTSYPINTALWFLRDLMIVVIFTPLIYALIKKIKGVFVGLLAIIYIILNFVQINYHCLQLSIAFFFFTFGAYCNLERINILNIANLIRRPVYLLFIINSMTFLCFHNRFPCFSEICKLVNTFLAPIVALNIALVFIIKKKIKSNKFLSSSGFFIYITHCLITARLTKVLFMLFDEKSDINILIIYLLAFILTICILLTAFYTFKRYTPKLLTIVTGRR